MPRYTHFSSILLGLSLRAAMLALLLGLLPFSWVRTAAAAPEAKILRIDPRASLETGDPVITTVVEVAQSKRVSQAIAHCATLKGTTQLGCMSEALEQNGALYEVFPFHADKAVFATRVDGMDRPAKYMGHTRWSESQDEPGVGTAWLVLVDADRRMGRALTDARALARTFVEAMGPQDIVNLMFFNDRQVVRDSRWLTRAQRKKALDLLGEVKSTYSSQGRNRPLLTILKTAATDAFKALGNAGSAVPVPMHQAMVVLSSGFGGTDPATTGPGALQLSAYMSQGRFPENNTALPKAPVPVVSVYFPHSTYDEFRNNSLDFMQNLANPDIGGFFSVMRSGEAKRAGAIVEAVRSRFGKLNIVKWRVSCFAPQITQSFKLVFTDVDPPILGDTSFEDVPIGVDPTQWPLAVDLAQTRAQLKEKGVYPGGRFRVFGDFCWGGDSNRAEVYFLPAGSVAPTRLNNNDLAAVRKAQKQLVAQGMRGRVVEVADTFAEFEAPDSEKILHGSGKRAVARIVLFDNKASRASGVSADTIVELEARKRPLPLMAILGGLFALTVLALLLVLLRTSRRPVAASGPTRGLASRPSPTPGPNFASRAVLQGAGGLFITLTAGTELKAGRDASQCALLMSEPRISGVHASLKLDGGQLWVRDEQSNNGTFVADQRVAPGAWTAVPSGARLRFGPTEITTRLEA